MDWVLIDLSSPQHAPSVWHIKEANNKAVKILKRRHRICINNNKRAAKKQRWKQARERANSLTRDFIFRIFLSLSLSRCYCKELVAFFSLTGMRSYDDGEES
ncbi:hypothetical protein NC651_014922 [Populus alba x Populus x berolinensis]|nr:hypothetical protein NC651_014922 [Populus alba x Populus x berolinensis]